jgi:DNA-binding NarL/FixJ family response regulator
MIKVVVTGNQQLVRAGIRRVFERSDGIDVVAEVDDGPQTYQAVLRHRPDVLLAKPGEPGERGIRSALTLTRAVVLLADTGEEPMSAWLRAGATGVLHEDVKSDELVEAVTLVARGGVVLAPSLVAFLVARYRQVDWDAMRCAETQVARLSDRERDVLGLLVRGMDNAEIARSLFLSKGAVKAHIGGMLTKMSCRNRVQAAIIGHRSGLFSQQLSRQPVIPAQARGQVGESLMLDPAGQAARQRR